MGARTPVEYATCFYRDKTWAKRFKTAGISKAAGWVTSPYRSSRRDEILRTVDAINREKPLFPAHVIELRLRSPKGK